MSGVLADDDPRRAWAKFQPKIRKQLAKTLPVDCFRCGQPVYPDDQWDVDHVVPMSQDLDLMDDISNCAVSHRSCNSKHGAMLVNLAKKRFDKQKSASPDVDIFVGESDLLEAQCDVSDIPFLGEMPENSCVPRICSPRHPRAVGTLGDQVIASAAARGVTFRWWQKLVLWRGLEVDENGEFCWKKVVVSTPRQSGKSILIRELAIWRITNGHLFGEPQMALHVSMNLKSSRFIQSTAWNWAKEHDDFTVQKPFGSERIIYDLDESEWQISAPNTVYGYSSGFPLIDEGHGIEDEVVSQGLEPVIIERANPQIWMFSTAHAEATDLMPNARREAIGGSDRTCLIEWSLKRGVDLTDESLWRSAVPHWTEQRHELMQAAVNRPGFAEQWVNQWPADAQRAQWPQGWASVEKSPAQVPHGCLVAVEEKRDSSAYVVTAGWLVDRILCTHTTYCDSFQEASSLATSYFPSQALLGQSLMNRVDPSFWTPANREKTRIGTSLLSHRVRNSLLASNRPPALDRETQDAKVVEHELGFMLSDRKSRGPVHGLKTLAWLCAAVEQAPDPEAAIW